MQIYIHLEGHEPLRAVVATTAQELENGAKGTLSISELLPNKLDSTYSTAELFVDNFPNTKFNASVTENFWK